MAGRPRKAPHPRSKRGIGSNDFGECHAVEASAQMMFTRQADLGASFRTLPLGTRPDLVTEHLVHGARPYWVIKDPIRLRYFRLSEEEYALFGLLDGRHSLEDLKRHFEEEFAPRTTTVEALQTLIVRLHGAGLLVADTEGQGHQLLKRQAKAKRRNFLAIVTNLLAIRFRGVDPDRFLGALYPFVRWCFAPWCYVATALLALAALMLVIVQFDLFAARLPAFYEFFGHRNWVWLAVTIAAVKVVHELGHGLSCKHFGGECHEIGVMLLVFTPCLYCNVSDSWMLPNKWQRIAIAAAGMLVEVTLASICTFLWWWSEPGLLHHLCLNVMLVCSVSTVLLNGNPLLRYDGYYILSDLLGIPNLAQKSRAVLVATLRRVCLGIESREPELLPKTNRKVFIVYAVASAVYRWIVLLSILWFLQKVFEPYRLEVIGQLIALIAIGALVVMPMVRTVQYLRVPGRSRQLKPIRMAVTLVMVGLIVGALVLVPFPFHVATPLVIELANPQSVYVTTPGTLADVMVRPGASVERGQELARLENAEIDIEIAQLTGQRDRQQARLRVLESGRVANSQIAAQIPETRAMLVDIEERLRQRTVDRDRLMLRASDEGVILPAEMSPVTGTNRDRPAPEGASLLDIANLGCYLDAGSVLCRIADPARLQAVLVIDQADVEFVREGQDVEIIMDAFPSKTFRGQIAQIAEIELASTPPQLTTRAGGELLTQTEAGGAERPVNTSYQVRVPLANPDGQLLVGLRGQAKVLAGSRTIVQRVGRYLARTFRFDL